LAGQKIKNKRGYAVKEAVGSYASAGTEIRYAYAQIRYSGVLALQPAYKWPTCGRIPELPILGVFVHFRWEADRYPVSYRNGSASQGDVSEATTSDRRISFQVTSSSSETYNRQRKATGGWCQCFPVFVSVFFFK
jgi:hypothetical protein